MNTQYITTPIYYVNDRPHLGHFYTTVAADILARWGRVMGRRVKFVTGTDEHGAKVAQSAESHGMTPQAYVDKMAQFFKEMVVYSGSQPDDFIRTTEPRHIKAAQALWEKLEATGNIYLGAYKGWYATRDEAFYPEKELIDSPQGKIAPTGAPVEWVEESCYFFRLSQWQQPLLEYYQQAGVVAPESRLNETVRFVEGGLEDLAISRSRLKWGVPVPGVPDHVMYVWIDALTNYITVLGYPEHTKEMKEFWPQSLHLVGKDILRFHTVYWPAFLMAAELSPPKRVFAHGWWTREGQKMSKSLGNVLDPQKLVEQYGVDQMRYFLFRQVRFGQDGDFSEHSFIQCVNGELAGGLGNLLHRTITLVHRYLGGNLPLSVTPQTVKGAQEPHVISHSVDDAKGESVRQWAPTMQAILQEMMEQQDFFSYLEEITRGIHLGNQYITQLAPWDLAKKGPGTPEWEHMLVGLGHILHLLRDMAIFLYPFMPDSCRRVMAQLGQKEKEILWSDMGSPMEGGISVPPPSPLFAKIEDIPSEKA